MSIDTSVETFFGWSFAAEPLYDNEDIFMPPDVEDMFREKIPDAEVGMQGNVQYGDVEIVVGVPSPRTPEKIASIKEQLSQIVGYDIGEPELIVAVLLS